MRGSFAPLRMTTKNKGKSKSNGNGKGNGNYNSKGNGNRRSPSGMTTRKAKATGILSCAENDAVLGMVVWGWLLGDG